MTPGDITVDYREVPDVDAVKELPSEFDVVAISSYSLRSKTPTGSPTVPRGRDPGDPRGLHVTAMPEEANDTRLHRRR